MTLDVVTIPCLSDNYAFLLRCSETGEVALVDAPEAGPIKAELEARNWTLNQILITHHHDDHIDGVDELRETYGATVLGGKDDVHRLPKLDRSVGDGDTFKVGNSEADVIDVSGHTIGHIAFLFKADKAAFTADSLMAMGCGRVFEGTHPQMWESLKKFKALPADTTIYSGHEYTASNAKFALTIEPENKDLQARVAEIEATRAKGGFTVPSNFGVELATNPFMRADQPEVKAVLGMQDKSDAEVFDEIRTRKDNF